MDDSEKQARLDALDTRIAAAKGNADTDKPRAADHHQQAHMAWTMVIELVAGLGIGFGMGYGLDAVFGTTPWLMIIFVFLGLAAGIKTMMRSAKLVQEQQLAAQAAENDNAQKGG